MSKRREDPVSLGDFYEFKSYVEAELASLRKEQEWVRASIDSIRRNLEKLEQSIDRYKWWIIAGFFSSSSFIALIMYLFKLVA
jgi:glucan phosphorylase